jgi:hypothetical protein
MAAHTAGMRVQRKRVEHIQQMAHEIGVQEHTAVHLISLTVRATFYFFMAASLVAAAITYANGKTTAATIWGAIGIGLVLILIMEKVGSRVMKRMIAALKAEFAEVQSHEAGTHMVSAIKSEIAEVRSHDRKAADKAPANGDGTPPDSA